MVSLGKQVDWVAVWDFKWNSRPEDYTNFQKPVLQGMTSLCAWKRQNSSGHQSIPEQLHWLQQTYIMAEESCIRSYTQNNLLAPSVGLKTTLLSQNFTAGFTLNALCQSLYRIWKLFHSLSLTFLMTLLMTGPPPNTECSRLASGP